MKIVISSFILLFFATTINSFAAIYQTLDADGNIVFTDKPEAGSTKKILIPPAVIKIKKVKEKKPVNGLGELKVKEKKAVPYAKFSIVSPAQDSSIRNNIGTQELKLKISPGLQAKFGHRIKVRLDDKMHKNSWMSSSILFKNIDRGTHTFQAFIVDKSGKRLKSSKTVTFHLQRFSRLFN